MDFNCPTTVITNSYRYFKVNKYVLQWEQEQYGSVLKIIFIIFHKHVTGTLLHSISEEFSERSGDVEVSDTLLRQVT